jgi:hypothetical protein
MKIFPAVIFSAIILSFFSCALQVPPAGGEKDIKPPELMSSSPENYSTGFTGHDIRLDFDEYVSLNDIATQLIVSPLLKSNPVIRIRKKSVFIHFDDTLAENTTYTFNFGEGIMDNNEGNKLDNFQFVFSTGNVIDSNFISGKIINAFDRKTEKGIIASLYKPGDDSLPFLQRPVYFSKTNDSGEFRIINIAEGNYKLIGLADKNADYLYLPGEESVGFKDSLIPANTSAVIIPLFREKPKPQMVKAYSEFPGKALLAFNGPVGHPQLKFLGDTSQLGIYSILNSKNDDTITIWYKNISIDSISLKLDTTLYKDTIDIRLFHQQLSKSGKKKNSFEILPGNSQTAIQHLHLPLFLQFTRPVMTDDLSKISFMEDSIRMNPEIDFIDSIRQQLEIKKKWKPGAHYDLFIPPGSFTDIFGDINDTFRLSFNAHVETDYGSLKITFKNSNSRSWILQLINGGGVITNEYPVSSDTIITISNIDPGIYKIKLISDSNGNRKWDTGNLLRHIQPEEVRFYPEDISIRSNWDVEVFVK